MSVAAVADTSRFRGMAWRSRQTIPNPVLVALHLLGQSQHASNALYDRCASGEGQAPATDSDHRRAFPQVRAGLVGLAGLFQASSAARIFWIAVSSVNGGSGGDIPRLWLSTGHKATGATASLWRRCDGGVSGRCQTACRSCRPGRWPRAQVGGEALGRVAPDEGEPVL